MLFPFAVLSWTLRMLSLTIRPSPGAKFLRGRGGRGSRLPLAGPTRQAAGRAGLLTFALSPYVPAGRSETPGLEIAAARQGRRDGCPPLGVDASVTRAGRSVTHSGP